MNMFTTHDNDDNNNNNNDNSNTTNIYDNYDDNNNNYNDEVVLAKWLRLPNGVRTNICFAEVPQYTIIMT